MKLTQTKRTQAMFSLVAISAVAALIVMVLASHGADRSIGTSVWGALVPVFMAGTPLLMVGSFFYGVINLSFEETRGARWTLVLGLLLLLTIAWVTSYALFSSQGFMGAN